MVGISDKVGSFNDCKQDRGHESKVINACLVHV